ncbi:MAG TPA: hypothetical protein VHZ32_17755 [Rhizomicrobium sp.]|jgi:hypothetical protein|nr:hypothetical protein [Rhizomicrobium sp.]
MTKYWFRQKRFGYGATPCTWQGWALTVLSSLLAVGVVLVGPGIRDNVLRGAFIVLGLVLIFVPTAYIAWRKTEGGWRWRS